MLQNSLAVAVSDKYPVSNWHLLVIPKRHTADYFDLGSAEVRACQTLLAEARNLVLKEDPTVLGFNVGINSGAAAGQTVNIIAIALLSASFAGASVGHGQTQSEMNQAAILDLKSTED